MSGVRALGVRVRRYDGPLPVTATSSQSSAPAFGVFVTVGGEMVRPEEATAVTSIVLGAGIVPLSVLGAEVDAYIRR
jgi:hypothetical protein